MKNNNDRDILLAALISSLFTGMVTTLFLLLAVPLFIWPQKLDHAGSTETRDDMDPALSTMTEPRQDEISPLDNLKAFLITGDVKRLEDAFPPNGMTKMFEGIIKEARSIFELSAWGTDGFDYAVTEERKVDEDKKKVKVELDLETDFGKQKLDTELSLIRVDGRWYLDPDDTLELLKRELLRLHEYSGQ